MMSFWKWLSILIFGLMVGEDFSFLGGLEVAGAGVSLSVSAIAFDSMVWGTAEEYGVGENDRWASSCGDLVFGQLELCLGGISG